MTSFSLRLGPLSIALFFSTFLAAQTPYCVSRGTAPWEIWNAQFSIANPSFFKASGKDGYGNFTALTGAALQRGQANLITISPEASWAGDPRNNNLFWRVWVDLNADGDFTDVGEQIINQNVVFTNGTFLDNQSTFLTPANATLGSTRLRMAMKYGSPPEPCETFDRGEVEDYTVQITEGVQNGLPDLTLANLNITNPSVPAGQILNWKVDIKNIGTAAATGNFNVKAYISTDNVLSANDIQDGTIPTGSYAAGFQVLQVAGASTIPASLGAGQYYLILKIDADNQITEGSETNNVLVSTTTFTVTTATTTSPICTNSLLTNGGYENGLTGWNGGGVITTVANSGASAIKICTDQQRVYQSVSAQAGKTYSLRAFFKTDDATSGTTGFINFKFLSSAYVPLSDRTLGGFNTTTYTNVLASPALGLDAYSLAAPAGTAFVEISVTKSGGTGCVFADDWCLTSAATTDPCVNDFISPTFTNCPTAARTITLPSGQTSTVVNWIVPTATDDCGIPTVIQATNYQNGGSFGVGTIPITYQAKDSKGNLSSCSFTINVVSSTTGNTADIAVSLASTPSVFSKFSPLAIAISAKNIGTQPMTNVKIEFKYPTGTVSGGTAIPSVGTWNEWCAGGVQCFTWTIPSLAANATATLNLPLYVLSPTSPIIAVAKLLSSTPTDGNAANNTATLTINKATSPTQPLIAQRPTQLVPIVFQKIAPNPVADEMLVHLESLDDREVAFQFSDAVGKTVRIENRSIEKGMNRVVFDVSNLPQGLYLIQTNVGKGRGVPTKFIKM